MIVGVYSLDLYCENEGEYNDGIHPFRYLLHSYVGETRQECFRKARANGWKLNFRKGTAICPICTRAKRKVDIEKGGKR